MRINSQINQQNSDSWKKILLSGNGYELSAVGKQVTLLLYGASCTSGNTGIIVPEGYCPVMTALNLAYNYSNAQIIRTMVDVDGTVDVADMQAGTIPTISDIRGIVTWSVQ